MAFNQGHCNFHIPYPLTEQYLELNNTDVSHHFFLYMTIWQRVQRLSCKSRLNLPVPNLWTLFLNDIVVILPHIRRLARPFTPLAYKRELEQKLISFFLFRFIERYTVGSNDLHVNIITWFGGGFWRIILHWERPNSIIFSSKMTYICRTYYDWGNKVWRNSFIDIRLAEQADYVPEAKVLLWEGVTGALVPVLTCLSQFSFVFVSEI